MTTKVGAVTRMLYQLGSGTDCDGEDNSDKRTELLLSASSCKKNTTAGCLPCRNSSPAIDARRMIVVPTSDVEVDDTLGRKEAGRREGRRKEGGLEPQPTLYQHHVQFPNPAALAGLNAANSRNTPIPSLPPASLHPVTSNLQRLAASRNAAINGRTPSACSDAPNYRSKRSVAVSSRDRLNSGIARGGRVQNATRACCQETGNTVCCVASFSVM